MLVLSMLTQCVGMISIIDPFNVGVVYVDTIYIGKISIIDPFYVSVVYVDITYPDNINY